MGACQHRAALGPLNQGEPGNPLLPALAAQALGILAVGLPTLLIFPGLLGQSLLLALLQGGIAALVARWQGAPSWWLMIHLGFMPIVVTARALDLPTWLWPVGLVLLLLVFWRTDHSRVPLYLSSGQCAAALLELLPPQPCQVIDLGCGDGAILRALARARPDCRFIGIEHAPLPWLWARLGSISITNLSIHHGDFWRHPLGAYDLVYAFLSPVPMPRLWLKAEAEMRPGALLVSNSFRVEDQPEEARVAVNDRAMTYLYVYRPGRTAV